MAEVGSKVSDTGGFLKGSYHWGSLTIGFDFGIPANGFNICFHRVPSVDIVHKQNDVPLMSCELSKECCK